MFNQASEETVALDSDSYEQVLENLHERQVKKSTPMTNAVTLFRKGVVLRKEPRSYQRLRTMVNDIPEQKNSRTFLISQQERSRDRAATACSSKKYEEKGKDGRALTFKGSFSKGGKCEGQRNLIKKSS